MKRFLRLILLLNWGVIVLTTIGYLASFVDPAVSSWPQVIGLFMPWLLLLNLFFFLFWLSLRKRWLLASLVLLIAGFGQITRFVGVHFKKESQEDQLGVCSFNSQSYNEGDHLNDFLRQIKGEHQIDFFCMQEITENHLPSLIESTGLEHYYFYKGKAILSRFPVEAQGHIQFDQSVNGCIWIDIMQHAQKIRIYNLHLKSNQVTREAETVLDDINDNHTRAVRSIRKMVSNYRKNSLIRKEQAQTILKDLALISHPVILAGDFNDTPFSYTYQQFSDRLTDHFKDRGMGIGSTYAGALPGLKIDYIFADESFEVLDHHILRTAISDHFPVLSLMKIKD